MIPEGWPVETLADHLEPAVKGVSYKGSGLGAGGVPLHNLNSIHEGGGYKYEGIKHYSGEHAERHVVLPGDVIVANTEQGHERLKATVDLGEPRAGFLSFRLRIKNYDDLRIATQTPRLLVVLDLPKDEPCWMTVTTEHLILRRRAYWLSLQHGHAEVVGQQGVTVRIPERNVFDVETLRRLMEQSRSGEI